jgi:hypothetical protein
LIIDPKARPGAILPSPKIEELYATMHQRNTPRRQVVESLCKKYWMYNGLTLSMVTKGWYGMNSPPSIRSSPAPPIRRRSPPYRKVVITCPAGQSIPPKIAGQRILKIGTNQILNAVEGVTAGAAGILSDRIATWPECSPVRIEARAGEHTGLVV